jgi:hypothetical protein
MSARGCHRARGLIYRRPTSDRTADAEGLKKISEMVSGRSRPKCSVLIGVIRERRPACSAAKGPVYGRRPE